MKPGPARDELFAYLVELVEATSNHVPQGVILAGPEAVNAWEHGFKSALLHAMNHVTGSTYRQERTPHHD